MKRRALLATLSVGFLAGCTAPDPPPGSPTDDGEPVPTTRTPQPGLVDVVFDPGPRRCGSPDATDAQVSFSGSTVRIQGTIVAPNTCYVAQLDTVVHDEQADRLVVTVAAERKPGAEACAQCITELRYTVVATMDGPLPEVVEVNHLTDDGVREVTAVRR